MDYKTKVQKIHHRHHIAYHSNNNGIILQFILFELMQTFEQVEIIKANRTQKTVIAALHTLGGQAQWIFGFWNLKDGILTKIKDHCAVFVANRNPQNLEMNNLLGYITRSWMYCLESLELIEEAPESLEELFLDFSEHTGLKTPLKRMINNIQRFAKAIFAILPQFYTDENFIYFLLTHKNQLEHVFGKKFVYHFLHSAHPYGIEQIRALLIKKYTKRGFTHILPHIARILAELEIMAAPCAH